jgi:hypothetical protein
MMYAKWTFVTAAKMIILSTVIDLPRIGEDAPISQTLMDACVQIRAYVEFWERDMFTFFALLPFPGSLCPLIRFFSKISSTFWDSRVDWVVVDEIELDSPEVLEDSFFDPDNFDLQLDICFSGGATNGTVTRLLTYSDSNETVEVEGSRTRVALLGDVGHSPAMFVCGTSPVAVLGLSMNAAPSADAKFSEGANSVRGLSIPCRKPGEIGETKAWGIERDRSGDIDPENADRRGGEVEGSEPTDF